MRILISLEHRFYRTPDANIWTASSHPYTFWRRYLDVFDQVDVLARVLDVTTPDPAWTRADGRSVRFIALPYFIGPAEYVRRAVQVRRVIKQQADSAEAVVMRVPSLIGSTLATSLSRSGHPFALEVVGDPYDVFGPRAGVRHPLRSVFRHWFWLNLRQQCQQAHAVAYVTEQALQKRYPSSALMMGISDVVLPKSAFTISYSSVELTAQQILASGRKPQPLPGSATTLVFIGSLEQLYKAPDVLIKAVAEVVAWGADIRLELVGDGRYKKFLQELAHSLGIANRCNFHGQISSGSDVEKILDRSDIFVLPSRVEALPRAMIEAMARGLPCIGSNVGGIPELLDAEYLVPSGDVNTLARKIMELVSDSHRQAEASERNIRKAAQYSDEVLRRKRTEFFEHVREFTSEWMHKQSITSTRLQAISSDGQSRSL